MRVSIARGEEARAAMLALFPEGFEERQDVSGLELVAYGGAEAEERLAGALGPVAVTPVETGWEERWKDFHHPVRIGPLWVGPPWAEPEAGAVAVVIDPGRAFGTGAHATTRLCLELLLGLEPTSLLDLGCGSGVLAVAAARIGFSPVAAVDSDEAAVAATRRNAETNDVLLEIRRADIRFDPLPEAAVVVANITLPIVEEVAHRLDAEFLVASGYPAADRPDVPSWRALDRRESGGWAADLFERFYH